MLTVREDRELQCLRLAVKCNRNKVASFEKQSLPALYETGNRRKDYGICFSDRLFLGCAC